MSTWAVLNEQVRDREPTGYRFPFPHRRFHRGDVARHVYVCTHVARPSCTQELVRVLQRYVIYVIRRNDNGYLHDEHRIATVPWRHSIQGKFSVQKL